MKLRGEWGDVRSPVYPASAIDEDATPLDSISSVAPQDVAAVANVTATANGLDAETGQINVTVDSDPTEGITVDAGTSEVGIGLPFADIADGGVSDSLGTLTFDNNNDTSSVAIARADGAIQVVTVIDDADAPTRFAYDIDLPDGAALLLVQSRRSWSVPRRTEHQQRL